MQSGLSTVSIQGLKIKISFRVIYARPRKHLRNVGILKWQDVSEMLSIILYCIWKSFCKDIKLSETSCFICGNHSEQVYNYWKGRFIYLF